MARISFKGFEDYAEALKKLEFAAQGGEMLEKAAKAGGAPVADEIRRRLRNLPEDEYRRLNPGEVFTGIPAGQKEDLLDSLGVTPPQRDRKGFVNVKVGFDGYGSYPTRAYPDGLPNQLLARAVESGSSVRKKTPFVRPAVQATRKEAVDEMDKAIRQELEKIFGK